MSERVMTFREAQGYVQQFVQMYRGGILLAEALERAAQVEDFLAGTERRKAEAEKALVSVLEEKTRLDAVAIEARADALRAQREQQTAVEAAEARKAQLAREFALAEASAKQEHARLAQEHHTIVTELTRTRLAAEQEAELRRRELSEEHIALLAEVKAAQEKLAATKAILDAVRGRL